MKNTEIKSLSTAELAERLGSETERMRKLKFAHAISPIENPMQLRASRRLIARLQTEYTARTQNNAQ